MLKYLFPVILCGGSGTRLWPLSRTALPKQFIPFAESSLFEKTFERVTALSSQSVTVCNHEHRFLVASTMDKVALDLKKHAIFLEPCGRNTALPIALSALYALEKNKDAVLLVLPSDHVLEPLADFKAKIEEIIPFTEKGIITFGIKPNTPHTGYGYIEQGQPLNDSIAQVKNFTEKPNLAAAKTLLETNALWNSGMFLMRADVYLAELKAFRADILQNAEDVWQSRYEDLDFFRFAPEVFTECVSESIDYAVMEKTKKAYVCPLDLEWNDLGSFQALHELSLKDEDNNAKIGDVLSLKTTNSYIHSSNALVSVLGMDNVAVVQTKDAVLVAPLDKSEEIKDFISVMKENNRAEKDFHPVNHRPWGQFESLINGNRFQVKHIIVRPGGVLSVQMHHHRSEHWIVVKGTAQVKIGEHEQLLTENQSVYIPLGEVHRLSNPGQIPLELIEVQTGSYLGDDDILRLEDAYGRTEK